MSNAPVIDTAIDDASRQINAARAASGRLPAIDSFFDEASNTVSHVVYDPASREAAIIDPVLDFDPASGRTSFASADRIIAHIEIEQLTVRWLIETHVHADHLSASPYLQEKAGGELVIGREIVWVQEAFGTIFNAGTTFQRSGSQFDHLFDDGDRFALGSIEAICLHVPGHTSADMAFVIGDAAFVGDTLFMPDLGTARADFVGGDARHLYRSIRRLLSLPSETRLFLCHDYKAPGRDHYVWETSVGVQREANVHVRDGVSEAEFVDMRTTRDKTLPMPRLLLPAVQVNMRGGRLPEPEENGTRYLRIPLDTL
jgi:glyoxylase-like metal-dependent hydrolase (beta-lactamase superfamily II)